MTGVKVSEYTVAESLAGDEKIPLGTGVKKATTPDQLRQFVGSTVIAPQSKSALLFDDFLDVAKSRLGLSNMTLVSVPAADMAAAGIDFIGAGRIVHDTGGIFKSHPLIDPSLADAHTVSMFDKLIYSTRIYFPSRITPPLAGTNKEYLMGLFRGRPEDMGLTSNAIASAEWSPDSPFFRLRHSGNQFVDTDVTPAQNTVYLIRIEWTKSTQSLVLFIDDVQKATATLSNYDSSKSVIPLFSHVSGAWSGTDSASEIWVDYMSMAIESSADRF